MKKRFLVLLVLIIFVLSMQTASAAVSPYDSVSVEYLDNGDSILTVIESIPSGDIAAFATKTETKSKTSYYRSASGSVLWYVRVTGTFTYGNGTAKCTSQTPSAASEHSDWKVSSIAGSKSGNTASATATGKKYHLGSVIDSVTEKVTLTCSPTGVFS